MLRRRKIVSDKIQIFTVFTLILICEKYEAK